MSNKSCLVLIVILVASITFIGCSGKRGPAGASATGECLTCHADNSVIRAIDGQWRHSIHASGNNIDRNTPPCSGCHTGLGFISRVSSDTIVTIDQPDVISCFACHEPHTNKNFNLRTSTPVALIQGGTFDRGSGNLCANCHQARKPNPDIPLAGVAGDTTTIRITSPFWGPHDGPQANVLTGQDAFVFAGATYNNSPHASAVTNGCPTCHMATPEKNIAGGHSMNMTFVGEGGEESDFTTGCNQTGCHSGLVDFNFRGLQDSVSLSLIALRTALIADSRLNPDTLNVTVKAPVTLTVTRAGALYNFLLVYHDRSLGVHNSRYVLDLLRASVAALTPTLYASRP